MSVLIVFFLWLAFYGVHSLLASGWCKRRLAGLGTSYRLIYNLLAVILFGAALYKSGGGQTLNWLNVPLVQWTGFVLLAAGLVVLFIAIRGYNLAEFAGLKQENATEQILNTGGLNAYVRHPLYTGTLLFLFGYWFALAPTNHFAAIVAATCVYLPFGIRWEETKLRQVFGQQWDTYADQVKAILPGVI